MAKKKKARLGVEMGLLLADAQRVAKAAKKYARQLARLGITEADRSELEGLIAQARVRLANRPGPVSLEGVRRQLQDQLRLYRVSAAFVAERPGHSDANARRALKPFGEFPSRDALLKSYIDGLPSAVASYSAQLAQRGFSRAQQAQLESAVAAFLAALQARGALLGEARAERDETDSLLAQLREQVSYLRKAGHAALYGQKSSSEFDRLVAPKKKPAKPVATAPA